MPRTFLLVYAFKPFLHYSENITEQIVAALPDRPGLTKAVFDVRFDREMFEQVLRRFRPEMILGMGQHPRARKIRIERRGVNEWIDRRGDPGTPVEADGPEARRTALKIPAGPASVVTYDAGRYVCNYSIYVTAAWAEREGAQSAFLHIPRSMDLSEAVKEVDSIVEGLMAGSEKVRG